MSNTYQLPFSPRPSKTQPSMAPNAPLPPPSVIVQPTPSTPIEHQQALSQRLTHVQGERARLANEAQHIEAEIASVKEGLSFGKRRLPMAKMLIASPCDESWSRMTGDEKTRFCKSCQKNVHNLAAMTTVEVEEFLDKHKTGEACIRLYERLDGTVLTADCPVGVKRRRMRMLLVSTLGAGACSLFAFTAIAITLSALNRPPKIIEVTAPTNTVYVAQPTPTVESGPRLPNTPIGKGWLFVHAPEGTKIFEGTQLLGEGPLVVALPAGGHTLTAEGRFGNKENLWVDITSGGKAELHFRGFAPRAGGMRRFPPSKNDL
jgi:hypothetical protein